MEISPITSYDRVLTAPPDKSVTHRAVMLNALALGTARVKNPLLGEDCLSTVECMRRLGAEIELKESEIVVTGRPVASAELYVGNSGTTARLLAGALAGRDGRFTIDGDRSLRSRPMGRIIDPLTRMGADIAGTDRRAPLRITGKPLHGIDYATAVASAQVKSAILLAGLSAEGETVVREPVQSRDHTERMLAAMGADIAAEKNAVWVRRSSLKPYDVCVAGDISSAAYPLVLAAIVPRGRVTVRGVGINPTRAGILEVLSSCGADLTVQPVGGGHTDSGLYPKDGAAEPAADITLRQTALRPFVVEGELVPRLIDEIPALAVLACFIEGTSVIRGAAELKVKESDRILTTATALRALGGKVIPTDDGMIIEGTGALTGGGTIDAGMDHRIAMAGAIALAASRKGGALLNGEMCAVSYPGFFGEVL